MPKKAKVRVIAKKDPMTDGEVRDYFKALFEGKVKLEGMERRIEEEMRRASIDAEELAATRNMLVEQLRRVETAITEKQSTVKALRGVLLEEEIRRRNKN